MASEERVEVSLLLCHNIWPQRRLQKCWTNELFFPLRPRWKMPLLRMSFAAIPWPKPPEANTAKKGLTIADVVLQTG